MTDDVAKMIEEGCPHDDPRADPRAEPGPPAVTRLTVRESAVRDLEELVRRIRAMAEKWEARYDGAETAEASYLCSDAAADLRGLLRE